MQNEEEKNFDIIIMRVDKEAKVIEINDKEENISSCIKRHIVDNEIKLLNEDDQ